MVKGMDLLLLRRMRRLGIVAWQEKPTASDMCEICVNIPVISPHLDLFLRFIMINRDISWYFMIFPATGDRSDEYLMGSSSKLAIWSEKSRKNGTLFIHRKFLKDRNMTTGKHSRKKKIHTGAMKVARKSQSKSTNQLFREKPFSEVNSIHGRFIQNSDSEWSQQLSISFPTGLCCYRWSSPSGNSVQTSACNCGLISCNSCLTGRARSFGNDSDIFAR